MNNMPIYRGRNINNDEYVKGILLPCQDKFYISEDDNSDIYLDEDELFYDGSINGEIKFFGGGLYEIDPSTLAIKMPERDFFMSLDVKTGKGGDIVQIQDGTKEVMECVFYKGRESYKDNDGRYHWCIHCENVKTIGIKE